MGRKIVLDSNILVALYKLDDSTHQKAKEVTRRLHDQGDVFYGFESCGPRDGYSNKHESWTGRS